jgi:hypothetical protein
VHVAQVYHLADESALHQLWMHMGANGIKLCVQCLNVVKRDWFDEHELPLDHFFRSYSDPRTFTEDGVQLNTKATICAIVDELAAAHGTMNQTRWNAKQTTLGFKYSPYGILADPALRCMVDPSQDNLYDWAHTILSGVFPTVVALIAEDLKDPTQTKQRTQTKHTMLCILLFQRDTHIYIYIYRAGMK